MRDRTLEFDKACLDLLRGIRDIEVFDSFARDVKKPLYIVYHGGAEINRYLNSYLSMAGHTQDVYEHPFYVDVYAENHDPPSNRQKPQCSPHSTRQSTQHQ